MRFSISTVSPYGESALDTAARWCGGFRRGSVSIAENAAVTIKTDFVDDGESGGTMTDIVERLRTSKFVEEVAHEAAVEIERLRMLLAEKQEAVTHWKTQLNETLDEIERLRKQIADEREWCALIAENYPTVAPSSEFVVQTTMEVAAECIAMSIRARAT